MSKKYLSFPLVFSFNTLLLNVISVPGFVQSTILCRFIKCFHASLSFNCYPAAFAIDLPDIHTRGAEINSVHDPWNIYGL